MGRRKIEIKAIKDDRNRSVTFLKRKGGLFKKAHELSVLCSVDVAVIIFGNNKKLYEYSSSDIGEILTRYQYYGGANEHKGPADFNGKGDDDDDDDDPVGSGPSHHGSVEPQIQNQNQMMPPHFQPHNPAFQHMRQHTPSASPPIPNGAFAHHPQHPQRQHTPQPQMGSRPSSRNGPRRPGSNLAQHIPQGPHPPPNNYAYVPHPAIYQPQNGQGLQTHPHSMPPHMQGHPQVMPHQGPPQYQQYSQQPQQHAPPPPPPPPQQAQPLYMEDQRRDSAPPGFIKQERPPSRQTASPPQPPQQLQGLPQIQHNHEEEQRQQPEAQHSLEPVKRMSVKSRSIFTPIAESRSILSQHWASSTTSMETPRADAAASNRSQSIDVGAVNRPNPSPPPPRPQTHNKNRVSMSSVSSVQDGFTPPSRTNSAQLSAAGGKRPVLKVQIPDEPSDGGSATADSASSPRENAGAAGSNPPQRKGSSGHSSGVVLPPPSPSASALLSAGASGPPNPFARPHPVSQSNQNNQGSNSNNNGINIETPVSALPSRFMNTDFLPSPSSFYPEWNFRGNGDGNTLPSPLNFATPVVGSGPSFLREDSGERTAPAEKRKSPEGESVGGDAKRAKHDS
ncbi:Transcription factor RLM1 [Phlyctema vagabunda]|uniref:Transcription factor RLM1 n=1 Tax=Phlyctema vagabunda TaxID=108571 RepID=A0ABR4PPV5_9HELO